MAVLPHFRYTWEGIVGTPAEPLESWSFSLKTYNGGPPPADWDVLALAAREAYSANLRTIMGQDTWLIRTKIASMDVTGRTFVNADGSLDQGEDPVQVQGSSAGVGYPMPLQTALVVSLGTARQGPTGKGRFFLPWPDLLLVASDRRLAVASANAVAAAAAGFVEDVGRIVAGNAVIVASSKGYHSPVNHVRVGRAPDTMRSRRSDLPEGYSTNLVAP